jgi:hypothetical protein
MYIAQADVGFTNIGQVGAMHAGTGTADQPVELKHN